MARSPEPARLFQQPDLPAQRHYEICRASFHDAITADAIAQRFHLHVRSVRAIRDLARAPDVQAFFPAAAPGRKTAPKRDSISQRACELRRQGATLADLHSRAETRGVRCQRIVPLPGVGPRRLDRDSPRPPLAATGRPRQRRLPRPRGRRRPRAEPRGGTAVAHHSGRPLPLPSRDPGPRPARSRHPGRSARLGADPPAPSSAGSAGPQAPRHAAELRMLGQQVRNGFL